MGSANSKAKKNKIRKNNSTFYFVLPEPVDELPVDTTIKASSKKYSLKSPINVGNVQVPCPNCHGNKANSPAVSLNDDVTMSLSRHTYPLDTQRGPLPAIPFKNAPIECAAEKSPPQPKPKPEPNESPMKSSGSKKFKVTKVVNFTPAKEFGLDRDYETVTTNDGAEPAAELKPAADEDVVNVKNDTKDSSSPSEFEALEPDDDAQTYNDFLYTETGRLEAATYSKNVQAVVNPIVANQTKLDIYESSECSDLNLKSEVDSTERLKVDCLVHYLWRIEERPNNSVLVISVIFGEENSSKFMSDRMCNDERYKKFNVENRFPLRMIKDSELGNPVEINVFDVSYKCDNSDIVLKPLTRTIPVYEYIKETPLHVAFHMDVDVPQSRLMFTRFKCNVLLLHIPATFSFYLQENTKNNQLDALIPEKVNKTTGLLGQDRSAPKAFCVHKTHEMANHACLSNQFHTLHTSEQCRSE